MFDITENMLESLDWAKERLYEEPVLRFPGYTQQKLLTTNASHVDALNIPTSSLDTYREGSRTRHLGEKKPRAPGFDLLRCQVDKGPGLPAAEAAARETPVRNPEVGRWSTGKRVMTCTNDSLGDKARTTKRLTVVKEEQPQLVREYHVGKTDCSQKVVKHGEAISLSFPPPRFKHVSVRGLLRSTLDDARPPKNTGMIVRLQGHLHLPWIGRGTIGEEAWARALLTYNSSLHTATGYTLLGLVRAWQREDSPVSLKYVCGELVDHNSRDKENRVGRINIGVDLSLQDTPGGRCGNSRGSDREQEMTIERGRNAEDGYRERAEKEEGETLLPRERHKTGWTEKLRNVGSPHHVGGRHHANRTSSPLWHRITTIPHSTQGSFTSTTPSSEGPTLSLPLQ
ncbi:hypothetical protein AAG570_014106 [Ranatra chinensis]|uniref:Uncharacterized protein n=1 Tax=Ranatra chinensis TaxID=642074 RepID=A0ABD0YDQ6_9HEMI